MFLLKNNLNNFFNYSCIQHYIILRRTTVIRHVCNSCSHHLDNASTNLTLGDSPHYNTLTRYGFLVTGIGWPAFGEAKTKIFIYSSFFRHCHGSVMLFGTLNTQFWVHNFAGNDCFRGLGIILFPKNDEHEASAMDILYVLLVIWVL